MMEQRKNTQKIGLPFWEGIFGHTLFQNLGFGIRVSAFLTELKTIKIKIS